MPVNSPPAHTTGPLNISPDPDGDTTTPGLIVTGVLNPPNPDNPPPGLNVSPFAKMCPPSIVTVPAADASASRTRTVDEPTLSVPALLNPWTGLKDEPISRSPPVAVTTPLGSMVKPPFNLQEPFTAHRTFIAPGAITETLEIEMLPDTNVSRSVVTVPSFSVTAAPG